MTYELKEVLNMLHVYARVESEAKNFLFLCGFAMKNKEPQLKSAQKTIIAIGEYKKLPSQLRKELEKYHSTSVSKIIELEKICRDVIAKNKV